MTDTLPDIVEQLKKSIVQVKLSNDRGNGSGVIVDERGLIVTNRHVVGPEKTVIILDLDGNEFEGTLLRSDANIDYAIIKADVKEPISAKWNDDPVREGMTVVAIGHPLGYEFTVTKGIVSTSKRVLQNVEYIQTDVPINPGNSGGPLIDEEGEILGINSWMRSDAQNIGFAIPIRYILDALEEIEPLLDKLEETEYCNVCGFLNPDKPKYCAHCGVVMHRPEVKPPEKPQPPLRPSHKGSTEKEEKDGVEQKEPSTESEEKTVVEQEESTAENEEQTEPAEAVTSEDAIEPSAETSAEEKEQASDIKFCIHCGAENVSIAKFCKECGKPIS